MLPVVTGYCGWGGRPIGVNKDDLKAWMDERGHTAITLAEALDGGIRRETVHRWLNGTREIPALLPLALEGLEARKRRRRKQ